VSRPQDTYWRDFLLGASGLVIVLYLGKKLAAPKPAPPQLPTR
jgi:hypothetical protein